MGSALTDMSPPDVEDASAKFSSEVATNHTLVAAHIHIDQYCAANHLHPGTAKAAESRDAAKNMAFAQLSEICTASQSVPAKSTTLKMTLPKPPTGFKHLVLSLPKPDTLIRLVDEAEEKAKRFKAVYSDSDDDVSVLIDSEDEQPKKKPLIVESSSA